MRALGLPTAVLPWYPLLSAPPRFALHVMLSLLPGGREWLIRRGLAAQQAYLKTLFGCGDPQIRAAHVVACSQVPRRRPTSDARRVGKECGSTGRYGWSPAY